MRSIRYALTVLSLASSALASFIDDTGTCFSSDECCTKDFAKIGPLPVETLTAVVDEEQNAFWFVCKAVNNVKRKDAPKYLLELLLIRGVQCPQGSYPMVFTNSHEDTIMRAECVKGTKPTGEVSGILPVSSAMSISCADINDPARFEGNTRLTLYTVFKKVRAATGLRKRELSSAQSVTKDNYRVPRRKLQGVLQTPFGLINNKASEGLIADSQKWVTLALKKPDTFYAYYLVERQFYDPNSVYSGYNTNDGWEDDEHPPGWKEEDDEALLPYDYADDYEPEHTDTPPILRAGHGGNSRWKPGRTNQPVIDSQDEEVIIYRQRRAAMLERIDMVSLNKVGQNLMMNHKDKVARIDYIMPDEPYNGDYRLRVCAHVGFKNGSARDASHDLVEMHWIFQRDTIPSDLWHGIPGPVSGRPH